MLRIQLVRHEGEETGKVIRTGTINIYLQTSHTRTPKFQRLHQKCLHGVEVPLQAQTGLGTAPSFRCSSCILTQRFWCIGKAQKKRLMIEELNEDVCILILFASNYGIIKRICIKRGDLMKTDIKIAQETKCNPSRWIAEKLHLTPDEVEPIWKIQSKD